MAKKKPGPSAKTYDTPADRDAERAPSRKNDGQYGSMPPEFKGKEPTLASPSWIYNQKDPEKDLLSIMRTLILAQGRRLWENTFLMSLYANVDFMATYWGTRGGVFGGAGMGSGPSSSIMSTMPKMSDNRIRMCTDALVGKLIQSNSRIVMQTRMGDFSEWRKARKIELALEGEFARMRLMREVQLVATDALVTGDGFLKLYPDYDGKTICAERVFPNEIVIDEIEGAYGTPQKMYQLVYRRKDDVYNLYPDKWEIIRKAATTMPPKFAWTLYQPGMVEIFEAWALPYGNRPGRHIIACSAGVLFDEPWDKPFFPIIRFKGGDRQFGWYGAGWAEQVANTQINLNKLLNVCEAAASLGVAPFWVVQDGAGINIDHLTNMPGHVVTTASTDPKWVTNPPFHPSTNEVIKMWQDMIMTYYGMNEMEVTGEVPVNRLDSAEALKQFQAMGSVRHTQLLERWQEFFVDVGERVCMLASDIAKNNGGYPVLVKKAYAKAFQLDWKDLEIAKDSYMMSPAPANTLPRTASGRVDTLMEWQQSGLITPQQAQRAIASGQDLDAILGEVAANDDVIDRIIEMFTEFKEYMPPTPLMDLPHAQVRMSAARMKYELLGADKEVLALFDHFLADLADLIQMMTPPQPPMGGAPTPGMRPGGPAPVAPQAPVMQS
jgi:hypothetical protein